MPSEDQADILIKNADLFRDCFSAVLVEKLSQPSGSKPKKQTRASKRSSGSKPSSSAALSPPETDPANISQESGNDVEELAEFVDYMAATTFASLPSELRTLTHRTWTDNPPSLVDKYGPLLPLTGASLASVLPASAIDPEVTDSLLAYGVLLPDDASWSSTEDVLAPVLTAYISAASTAAAQVPRGEANECELCGRGDWIGLTYHHLIPRAVHAKVVKRGWHREDELQNVAWLCAACHAAVHRFASNEELARQFYTVDRLLAEEEIAAFARWVGRMRWKKR